MDASHIGGDIQNRAGPHIRWETIPASVAYGGPYMIGERRTSRYCIPGGHYQIQVTLEPDSNFDKERRSDVPFLGGANTSTEGETFSRVYMCVHETHDARSIECEGTQITCDAGTPLPFTTPNLALRY